MGLGAIDFGDGIKAQGVYLDKDGIPAKCAMLGLHFCYDTVSQGGA